ncbi:DUF3426 domain-containing protein [Bordetella genomosp. 13]|uniref:Zinc finger/thioredoxin putative domain-containing protein n=1 Tax=Bordetella genomosp. 13 TaxID=463040 RepID=A0A1W6ZGS8_9BORD|nr:DUF3426 domain-containing protein [Bordetella genomosp. 13]ARP96613.1 hypothetical protein CAL15_20950 [Bordetella genomosp. 13]
MPITRCPQCRTAFRVVADQLRVRNGLVRCGVCNTVFDGRAAIEDAAAAQAPARPAAVPPAAAPAAPPAPVTRAPAAQPAQPAAPELPVAAVVDVPPPAVLRGRARNESPVSPTPAEHPSRQDRILHAQRPAAAPPAWQAGRTPDEPPAVLRGRASHRHEPGMAAEPSPALHDRADERHDDPEDEDGWTAEPVMRERGIHAPPPYRGPGRSEPGLANAHADDDEDAEPAEEPVYGDSRTRYSSATDSGRAPPDFLDQDRIDSQRIWRRALGWACALGLLALVLQLVYVYRTPIALSAPTLRPVLSGVCQVLGCTVGYARRIERISIVSSSLRPPTGASQAEDDGRSRLVLTVVIRNRYDREQHWPALMLDLTDLSDTVVARKAILPEQYLPPGQADGPLGAGAEVTLTIPIQVNALQVNGYQLDKFFP